MSERSDLMDEANELGLEFAKNIKTTKLAAMVAEAKGDPIPVEETAPPSPAIDKKVTNMPDKHSQRRAFIQAQKKKALKTSVVTVTNKDPRENEYMTTAFVSFENQHFGLSKIIPLDVPVELEYCLVRILESTNMTLHKDEIIDGKRTGNKRPTTVKKFAISYAKSN